MFEGVFYKKKCLFAGFVLKLKQKKLTLVTAKNKRKKLLKNENLLKYSSS